MKSKDMGKDMDYAKLFTNMMSEGFIFIDSKGEISLYNDSAKEIFGILDKSKIYHSKGKIREGDIVIIANNSMGSDDGNMNDESLELLGLKKGEIKKEEPFILISRYKGENISKVIGRNYTDNIGLNDYSQGININCSIDFKDQVISIKVEEESYNLDYINAIGNMVILDGSSKKLKFYQSKGYTARRESINEILKGNEFKEKGIGEKTLDVIGKNIFDIHKSESIIEDFFQVAKGKNISYKDKYEEINGYPTLCTLNPVEEKGSRIGAALKVEDISKIEKVIKQRDHIIKELENTSREIKEKKAFKKAFPNFIGEDENILEVKRLALRSSKTLSNVLLIGESGVGKTLLAKSIHNSSCLKKEEFIHLSGKSLDKEFLKSSLNNIDKGTLYIDEIENLDMILQDILLSFILKNENKNRVRIITSTKSNLDGRIIENKFNENLYYKINVFPILIPALRDRKSDIKKLIDYILPKICKRANTEVKRVSSEAYNLIMSYHWPDNVSELINVLERAVNLSLGNNILTKHIVLLEDINKVEDEPKSLKEQLEEREKVIIQSTLSLYKGNKQKAIEDLKVSQSTFYEKLKKYGINQEGYSD